jgi:hypothetical protein
MAEWQTTKGAKERIRFTLIKEGRDVGDKTYAWLLTHGPLLRRVIELGECATRPQILELIEAEIVVRSMGGDNGDR